MICSRSREAALGVRLVQKYFSASRPTTGMPFAAKTLETPLSMAAQPPSPLTKTTRVSDVPLVAGTKMSGKIAHNSRSEEHTSELQSHSDLVCRLLVEKR